MTSRHARVDDTLGVMGRGPTASHFRSFNADLTARLSRFRSHSSFLHNGRRPDGATPWSSPTAADEPNGMTRRCLKDETNMARSDPPEFPITSVSPGCHRRGRVLRFCDRTGHDHHPHRDSDAAARVGAARARAAAHRSAPSPSSSTDTSTKRAISNVSSGGGATTDPTTPSRMSTTGPSCTRLAGRSRS